MENIELGPTGLDRQTDTSWQNHEFTKIINYPRELNLLASQSLYVSNREGRTKY